MEHTLAKTAIKSLIFTIVVPGTVAGYVPYLIQTSRSECPPTTLGVVRYAGLIPIVLGVACGLWCAGAFVMRGRGTPAPIDPPTRLVASGLYRYTRNPMYVAVSMVLMGEAIVLESAVQVLYACLIFAAFHIFVIAYEEPHLRRTFDAAYETYCRQVPRWIVPAKR